MIAPILAVTVGPERLCVHQRYNIVAGSFSRSHGPPWECILAYDRPWLVAEGSCQLLVVSETAAGSGQDIGNSLGSGHG